MNNDSKQQHSSASSGGPEHHQPSPSAEETSGGPHDRSIEVRVRLGEKYGVIVAKGSDTISSIKVRSLMALELSTDAASDYVLWSGDREVEVEAQTLHHLLGGNEHHHVEFHLKKRHGVTLEVKIQSTRGAKNFSFARTAKVSEAISHAVSAFGFAQGDKFELVLATSPGEPLQPERTLVSYGIVDGTVLILTAIGGGV